MYAPQAQPFPAPVALRLIGLLDADLIAGIPRPRAPPAPAATVLVDVRDLELLGEDRDGRALSRDRAARGRGRDVRLDARSLHWKPLAKKNCLRAAADRTRNFVPRVRRTVILRRTACGASAAGSSRRSIKIAPGDPAAVRAPFVE